MILFFYPMLTITIAKSWNNFGQTEEVRIEDFDIVLDGSEANKTSVRPQNINQWMVTPSSWFLTQLIFALFRGWSQFMGTWLYGNTWGLGFYLVCCIFRRPLSWIEVHDSFAASSIAFLRFLSARAPRSVKPCLVFPKLLGPAEVIVWRPTFRIRILNTRVIHLLCRDWQIQSD